MGSAGALGVSRGWGDPLGISGVLGGRLGMGRGGALRLSSRMRPGRGGRGIPGCPHAQGTPDCRRETP